MQNPKGILIAIGGAENKGDASDPNDEHFYKTGILSTIVGTLRSIGEPVIEVITTASSTPAEVALMYEQAFQLLGCENVHHFQISSRAEADHPQSIARLEQCNCIMFTGGDQLQLSSALGGTQFLEKLKYRYQHERMLIAGTSAGAMAMSSIMISGGNPLQAHKKGEVKIGIGFSFLENVIIDTHFDKRGRFNRLAQAVASQPGILGIGLAEDTGIIIESGKIRVIGTGCVTLLDGKHITRNNIAEVQAGKAISVEHLVVHLLTQGDEYQLWRPE